MPYTAASGREVIDVTPCDKKEASLTRSMERTADRWQNLTKE